VILYWYDSKWNTSSTGTPDAGSMITEKYSFSELFWEIWKKKNYRLPKNNNLCYMFEMVTPRHTIIVQPTEENIVFHGARDLITFRELDHIPIGIENGWNCVKSFQFNTIQDTIDAARKLNPLQAEGFVVRDADFNRLKIKCPNYVALSHLGGSSVNDFSVLNMLQLIKSNENTEFLTYFPDAKFLYETVFQAYKTLMDSLLKDYQKTLQIVNDKKKNITQINTLEIDYNENEAVNLELKRNLETIPKNLKELRLSYCRIIFSAFVKQIGISDVVCDADTTKVVPLVTYFLEDDIKKTNSIGLMSKTKKKKEE